MLRTKNIVCETV